MDGKAKAVTPRKEKAEAGPEEKRETPHQKAEVATRNGTDAVSFVSCEAGRQMEKDGDQESAKSQRNAQNRRKQNTKLMT